MKNIVLISIDNLRFDCIGYQPDKKELIKYDVLKHLETPTLDRIAEKSLCFTQCISTNTYTTAAHASILTGLYPPNHGVRGFYDRKVSRDVYTLAEVLRVFGYETVMLTDTKVLFLPFDLHRGFDHVFFIDEDALFNFLEERKGRKLFLFAHLYDVHEPFLLSKNARYISDEYLDVVKSLYDKYHLQMGDAGRKDFKRYRKLWLSLLGRIGFKDHETFFPLYVRGVSTFDGGRFRNFTERLEGLGMLEDALMVIASDHGEGKSEEVNPDHFTHGVRLFDSVVRVPLMVHHPDFSHRLTHSLVSIVDVFPTIIDLAIGDEGSGLFPYRLDGLSLKDLPEDREKAVYSETWRRDDNRGCNTPHVFLSHILDQRCMRTKEMKYIVSGEPESLEDRDVLGNLGDEEFIQYVYRGILRRFEGYDEYLTDLRNLKAGAFTREEFLKRTLDSREYVSAPQYYMYNLRDDPYEERPIPFEGLNVAEALEYFNAVKTVSGRPVRSESIFLDDGEIITGLLRKSGRENWEEQARMFLNNKHLLTCLIGDFLAQQNISNIPRERKLIQNMILSSKEFSLFLYERISRKNVKLPFMKRILKRYVPYSQQLRIYYFLSSKIFPETTLRGRLWQRAVSKILNA